jgi:carbamoyltransferase
MPNPIYVIGISAFYHDSAAAIIRDGEIIAAAQEERFTRKKHDPRFPVNAIQYCLEAAQIEPTDLAAICFYDNPALSLDRIIRTLIAAGNDGLSSWLNAAPSWLNKKLFVERQVREELKVNVPVLFSEHHFSHAASAFYPSPFAEAAVLTVDGVGEWATTTLGVGNGSDLQILEEIYFPHSLGLLYSAFTQFCGFKVNTGEYKLMGLAPYGKPIYADIIYKNLIDIKEDGSFKLNLDYFGYINSECMTNAKFASLFGGDARAPESRISRREMDLAASIQHVTEDIMIKLCRHLRGLSDKPNLCLAGGVALNCVANGKILREGIFEKIWIQPAAGDAGGAIGAAQMVSHVYFNIPRFRNISPLKGDRSDDYQKGSYLGPSFSNPEIKAYLCYNHFPFDEVTDEKRAEIVAQSLADGKIVGYMVGRSEFGPRSLGARSILGDARNPDTQSKMNLKIKYRESFRPFAPSVLPEYCNKYFDLDAESPYMLLVSPVQEKIRTSISNIPNKIDNQIDDNDLIAVVNQARSSIPAVTHVDYSARVQTVDSENKPDYYQVLKEFEKITGYGVIVNTSFNVRGEPIVCSPQDAYKCFMRTDIDVLVMENYILYKEQQPNFEENENWQNTYELD